VHICQRRHEPLAIVTRTKNKNKQNSNGNPESIGYHLLCKWP